MSYKSDVINLNCVARSTQSTLDVLYLAKTRKRIELAMVWKLKKKKEIPDARVILPDSGVRFTLDQIQLKRITTLFEGHHWTDIDGSKGSTCPVALWITIGLYSQI